MDYVELHLEKTVFEHEAICLLGHKDALSAHLFFRRQLVGGHYFLEDNTEAVVMSVGLRTARECLHRREQVLRLGMVAETVLLCCVHDEHKGSFSQVFRRVINSFGFLLRQQFSVSNSVRKAEIFDNLPPLVVP